LPGSTGDDLRRLGTFTLVLGLFLSLVFFAGCSEKENLGRGGRREEPLLSHLIFLTDEAREGRRGGSRGEGEAALYIARLLKERQYLPWGDGGTFFQVFPLENYELAQVKGRMIFHRTSPAIAGYSENILAFQPGEGEGVVVVSAHYDHLGKDEKGHYPGGNDNASGVALALELAAALKGRTLPFSLLFAFWGAEEMGLLGSYHFCRHPPPGLSLDQIRLVINYDSVGKLEEKELLGWLGEENDLGRRFLDQLAREGWKVVWEEKHEHQSDHLPFAEKGIPSFTLLSPKWLEDNHTPRDTVDSLNLELLQELLDASKKALLSL
jgi:aminopeptidase YwaD